MQLSDLLSNQYAVGTLTFVVGIAGTIATTQILSRRSTFRYFVWHNRVGLSTNDLVFGTIQVTWNNTPIAHLYHSKVELTNDSFRDFQDVVIRVYTADTRLLSQRTAIVDTPAAVPFTDDYAEAIRVPEGQTPTAAQFENWNRDRQYKLATFNRGQKICLQYLNAADTEKVPSIWVHVNHPGVRLRFHEAAEETWGIPKPRAALAGILFGVCVLAVVLTQLDRAWVVAVVAFVLGLFAQLPGAAIVKAWRGIRAWYGG